jgi:DNA-binding LytR/AlgR family response regulator
MSARGLETSAIRSRWLAAISQHLIFGLPATALLFLILALALRRTGIDLADEIRRRHFDLPVVLTSGYSHLLSQNDNYKFELLQKPYSIEQFARGLDEVGRWRRQNRGAAE